MQIQVISGLDSWRLGFSAWFGHTGSLCMQRRCRQAFYRQCCWNVGHSLPEVNGSIKTEGIKKYIYKNILLAVYSSMVVVFSLCRSGKSSPRLTVGSCSWYTLGY